MIKPLAATIYGILLAAFSTAGIFFGLRFYEGAKPALLPPPKDISAQLQSVYTTNTDQGSKTVNDSPLKVESGFRLKIFASGLGGPRMMVNDPDGLGIIVSIPSRGEILELVDNDHDGKADATDVLLKGLDYPHGLSFWCLHANRYECKLFVAETNAVRRYDWDADKHKPINGKKILDLPSGGVHVTRSLQVMGTDQGARLLISVGSSCNVCNEKDWRRAKILVANTDGTDLQIFASGLRNSVFMAFNPWTDELWATEMGRDLLGDDLPPDEINIIAESKDYGWPYCYGKQILDKKFDTSKAAAAKCLSSVPAHIEIPAHSAPLGLAFVPDTGWPAGYSRSLFVSYHGSWNRSVPTGYKIVRYQLDEAGRVVSVNDFISGWLTSDGALGRPTGLLALPNGKLYIADDKAGVIYEVTHETK